MDNGLWTYMRYEPETTINRREFLRLMGASLALAGLAGCNARPPVEQIVPYVRQPEEIVLGEPLFYATAATLGGYALGILAESHEGRPTKIEGNPLHPASLGATDIFAQASVLSLYDPDRAKDVLHFGQIATWESFLNDLRKNLANQRQKQGAGLRILTETIASPTFAFQIQDLLKDFPNAIWHQYEPINRDNEFEGAKMAFGADAETVYQFDKADVILSLDADFLFDSPARVRYARDFSKRQSARGGNLNFNRLYVVESSPTITGAAADNRLSIKSTEIENFARVLAGKFGIGQTIENIENGSWIDALVKDLNAHHGSSIVVAGRSQPPVVHALAHALNNALGNVGKTVFYTEPVAANSVNQLESLREIVGDIDAGRVEMLIIIGGNPAYNSPADFHFSESLQKVAWRVALSLYNDETSALCNWNIPAAHELETWSDTRAFDGTASIIQPLIAPLFNGKSAHEFLAAFTDSPDVSSYDIVRGFWLKSEPPAPTDGSTAAKHNSLSTENPPANAGGSDKNLPANAGGSDKNWRQALRDGFIANTAFAGKSVNLKTDWLNRNPQLNNPPANAGGSDKNPQSIELVFKADPTIYDGRFANNGWLQELPKPLTKLTWDNAALMSAATAKKFGLNEDIANTGGSHGQITVDVVELNFNGKSVRAPVFIVPQHADDSVTVQLGYGRNRAGQIGNGAGFDAYILRNSQTMWFGENLEITKTGEQFSLACTQFHADMEGRELIRAATLAEYKQNPNFAKREADDPQKQISLYPGWKYEGHAWGMAVDTGSCIGCNACVVACQAENNIPIVGKPEVLRAREMHWIRVDRYYENDATLLQPVMCQHCENAPCELVCPVEATTHSAEGLNEMTYNRCVGTRYCSNNCPYKVRRFNFFQYSNFDTPLVQLQRNPEVTVRSRGVMEKCTYCVQRIQHAKIDAETEGREVKDGEIVTACQQVCPTEAIVFGDINDPNSKVSKLKNEATNYGLLAELNTRPRTSYLATVRNPNEEMSESPA
ncbi:MAG: 4Fe-4S dicluster domain-containing protein [Pyrinomonadaceae bacterium]